MENAHDDQKVRLYRIEAKTIRLLKKLSKSEKRTLSGMVDIAVQDYAKRKGLTDDAEANNDPTRR